MKVRAILTLVAMALGGLAAGPLPSAGPALAQDAARPSPSEAEAQTQAILGAVARKWFEAEWAAYAASFITPDGRVVDNANGNVSHSEGQGYGLLLARIANDPERFQAIWHWTERHLKVRPDHLLSWKWDPAKGAVTDTNTATDGDILVAWALADAARQFNRPDYLVAARQMAESIGREVIEDRHGSPILLPGVSGFHEKDQPDGPVINLSYWVFPAFRTLKELAPGHDWEGLEAQGLAVLAKSGFGPLRLPADWQSLAGPAPVPAKDFPPRFGYDAIRIPLYLAWAGGPGAIEALHRFAKLPSGAPSDGPFVYDITTGSPVQRLDGSGYRLILALARCATAGGTIDPDIIKSRDALYYPETLRLLSLAVIRERYPQCL